VKHVHHKLVHEKARAPPKQVPIPEQRVAQKRKAIYSGMLADMYPQDGMQVDKKYKYAVPVVRPHSSPPVYGQTKVNVNAPSIPTLLLSSEHLSSPMTTPLHAGHRFDAFESIDPLSLTASAANNTISEASKTRIPNTQYRYVTDALAYCS
jgi:hypothetical protein